MDGWVIYECVCVCVWYVCVYGMRIYVYDMICMYVWMDVCMACMYGWVYGWDIRRMQVCDAPADCAVGFLWHDFFLFFLFSFFSSSVSHGTAEVARREQGQRAERAERAEGRERGESRAKVGRTRKKGGKRNAVTVGSK